MIRKTNLILSLLGLLLCACLPIRAEKATLFYAGFAYAGNAGDIAKNYPVASQLDHCESPDSSFFQKQARQFFKGKADKFTAVTLDFGLVRPGDTPLVLALALTDEKVLQEELGDFHKLVIQLGFELLVLDFREMTVVSSCPIGIELIDAKKTAYTDSDLVERMRTMVEGNDSQLLATIAAKAQRVAVGGKNQSTIQIAAVSVGEKALPFLPRLLQEKPNLYAKGVAQQLGSLLSSQAGLAMLPYAKDALNSKMACRFADGQAVQFTIPAPTFAIDVDVKGFKKVPKEKTDAEQLWIYGAFLDLKVYEPETKTIFYSAPAKYGVSKIVPASQKNVDEFPVVSEALKGAMLTAIEQMQKDQRTQEKVLQKCRL